MPVSSSAEAVAAARSEAEEARSGVAAARVQADQVPFSPSRPLFPSRSESDAQRIDTNVRGWTVINPFARSGLFFLCGAGEYRADGRVLLIGRGGPSHRQRPGPPLSRQPL